MLSARLAVTLALIGIIPAAVYGSDWSTDKFAVALTLTEEHVGGQSSSDIAVALDAIVSRPMGSGQFEFTVDSDYDRAFESAEEDFDRLKTWMRYLLDTNPDKKWVPLIVVSTEGDHGLDVVQTVAAFGWRNYMRHGFLELTAGASKDVQAAEPWVGDVGLLFDMERRWNRFTWDIRPSASMGVLGETHLRGEELLYSLSTGLNYKVGDNLGVAYRVQFNNTQGEDQRHQFLGISYSK